MGFFHQWKGARRFSGASSSRPFSGSIGIGSRIGRAGRDGLGGFTKGWQKIIIETNTFAIFQFCLVPFVSSFVTNARRSLPLLGPP
ncbi:MAG: hypothetical protein CK530_08800 [Planctomycetaceae bacterium]|nr:MAG: hypothetical protein CK530_08800 [Planctomycetaceae bacterium]